MKKLLDSKFLFILALSIVVLIILGVGAFYLFDDKDDVFVKDGYILNPLSAKNEKYLFDKDTPYKENLSSMVVFNDTDNNEVSVFKDSFLHYMDSSLSFLKNGAILDLDSISGSDAVKFYNITSKSVISKSGEGYVIETNGEDINLKNFMGRISDNKYIVAGSLEAKIPGNEKNITGNYFEIVYNNEGVITIENSEVKYQVAAEGSYIYAGDVVIDLGNKKITKAGEDVMSITAITINGDENIEIIPKAPSEEDEEPGNNGNGGEGTGNGENQGGTDADGDGAGGGNDAREDIKIEDLLVSLKDYEIYSTKIVTVFDIINQREDDSLILKITDLDTGKTVDRVYDVLENQEIRVSKLSPDTKYLFTVINERDGNKYFQKILKTKDFGISLEQSYVTSNEIGYKVIVDDESEIEDIDITLMKFDENNKDYNPDDAMTYHLSDIADTIKGEHDGIVFSGLDSDTIYTVALDGFVINSIKTEKIYNITMTTLTLKETPTFGTMNKEINDDGFKLFIENVVDKDSAIQNYTYYIFDNENDDDPDDFVFDPDKAVTKLVRTTAEPVELKIGENGIETNHNYLYMVSVEYYDNEKYVEYVIDGRIDLFIGNDPYVTIQKGTDIGYDYINATITITDNSCLIAMKDRTCFSDYENNPVVIDVKERDAKGNLIKVDGYPMNVNDFDQNGSILRKNLYVAGLKEGTTYVISVSAARKDKPEEGVKPLKTGAVYENEIETKYLASFNVTWIDGTSTDVEPINGTFKLDENKNEYSVSGSVAANLIEKVIFRLYDGAFSNSLAQPTLLATSNEFVNTDNFNIKNTFYDNEFPITQSLFGIADIDALRALTREKTGREGNKLSPYYTVVAEVYYENGSRATLYPPQHAFPIAAYLTNDVDAPILTAEEIWKSSTDNFNSGLTIGEGGAVVGYDLHVRYDKAGYDSSRLTIENINIYVYNGNKKVSFYTDDKGHSTSVITKTREELTEDNYDVSIYMADGVENGTSSEFMTRGKKYNIVVEINYKTVDGGKESQLSEPKEVLAKKETPKISQMYVAKTTKTGDVTYKYKIVDVDNAWYKEDNQYNIYYTIGDSEEAKVPVVKNTDELETFIISGLVSGSWYYTLSYKFNDYDTGNSEFDTRSAIIGDENRLFEGYYDVNDEKYNFKYQVISDPLHDNKVTVKILASNDILDKILIYKVKFADRKGNVVPYDIWNLVKCNDDSNDEKNRCFQVEYKKLKDKGMKSEGDEKNYITVSIDAIYDNGLMGFDYIDDIGPDKKFPYMIMQADSTLEKTGNYFIVNSKSLFDISSSGNRSMPLGYYYFAFKYGGIEYKSQYKNGDDFQITYTLDNRGYYVSGAGSLNPKMVSVEPMEGVDSEFYFSSITPMIHNDKVISLINGAKAMLTLSGAESNDFCADNSQNTCVKNGDKYLYLQVLDEDTLDIENSGNVIAEPIRPTVKVKLNNGDDAINGQYVTGDSINKEDSILGLSHNKKYYFKVYAYLNDGGTKKLTQIFDSTKKNSSDTYPFATKKLSGEETDYPILANTGVVPQAISDGGYNDKELVITVNLNPYDSEVNIPYNFDVTYEFCKENDCDAEGSRLFRKTLAETTRAMNSNENISALDFEFGRKYYMYLYMTYDYYDKGTGSFIKKTVPVYDLADVNKTEVNIPTLSKPSFVVSRWADYIEDAGRNTINLKLVNVYDDDQVLNNSNFYVKLVKSNDETGAVQGYLMLENEDGIFTQVTEAGKYDTYAFVSDERSDDNYQNKTIRIGGLEADTKYTLIVYGDAHINNSNTEIKDIRIFSGKDGTGDQIWSSNNYGVAFGRDITYRATENGFIVRYPGGSNLDEVHVNKVEVDVKDYNGKPFYNKTFTIGENNKYFTGDDVLGRYRFVIEYDEAGKKNEQDETYLVATRYYVYNPETGGTVRLDETYNASFEQNVTYDPDQVIDDE